MKSNVRSIKKSKSKPIKQRKKRRNKKSEGATRALSRTFLSHLCVVCLFSLLLSLSLSGSRSFGLMNIQSSLCMGSRWLFMCRTRTASWRNWKTAKKRTKNNWTRIAEIDELKTRDNQANERVNEKLLSHAELVKFRSRMHHTSHELWPTKIIWIRVLHTSIIFTSVARFHPIRRNRMLNQTG